MPFPIVSFVITLAVNWVLSRLSATDGPRLKNKNAGSGEYGVPMPRLFGEKVRVTDPFIGMADIKEKRHKIGKQGLFGAVVGGITGGLLGGPVGLVVGAAAGFAGGKASQKYFYTYSDTFAAMLADRAGQDPILGVEKIWASEKLIFKASEATVVGEAFDGQGRLIWRKFKKNKYFKSLTIYTGHEDQPVDPILASTIDEDCGYIFSAIAVFEDLQLEAFGQSVPEIEALVVVSGGESLAKVFESIVRPANIDTSRDISTTALTPFPVRGYGIVTETNCWDALKPLLPAFGADCADVDGQLRAYLRSQSMRASIAPDEMGAYFAGDTPPEPYTFRRETDLNLPQQTSVTFIDPSRDYQPNTATAARTEGDASSNVAVTIPLVLSADEGAKTAALMHWDSWLGRTGLSFTLTDPWIGISVGLAYAIPFTDRVVPYRITRRLRGAGGLLRIEAVSDEAVTYTASVAGSSGTIPDDDSTLFPDTRVMALDTSILDDAHDDYGFYLVMGDVAPGWSYGQIQVSNGGDWATLVDGWDTAVMGDVTGILPAGSTTGLDDTLDTTSTLTVVLLHDGLELESATDDELDAGANFAFVGKDGLGEYLQFKTATKVATATWELTDLRRGRRGSDFAIATHEADEEFVLLTGGAGVFRVDLADPSGWGDPLQFRGVTLHQDEDDAAVIDFTNTGEGKRPYSPIEVEGSWDGSYNLTGTFTARSRLDAGGLGIDDLYEFEVEILNATPVRTITVTAETFDYSAADQATDGLTPGGLVDGRVRQLSDVNDGRWREFTLLGPQTGLIDMEDETGPLEREPVSGITKPFELED